MLGFIAAGAKPSEILALSFTKAAADEMAKRIKTLLRSAKKSLPLKDGEEVQTGTFHSLGLSLIREHAAVVGLPGGDNLVLHKDPYKVVREGIREYRENNRNDSTSLVSNPSRKDVDSVVQEIQRRKASGAGFDEAGPEVAYAQKFYVESMAACEHLDFGDMLSKVSAHCSCSTCGLSSGMMALITSVLCAL